MINTPTTGARGPAGAWLRRSLRFSLSCAVVLTAACGAPPAAPSAPREVMIVGHDYAFQGPTELPAGWVTFRFRNAGKVRHEFNVSLLKPGATVAQFIAAATSGETVAPYREQSVGVLFAEPDADSPSGLTTDLLPGRTYVVQCVFRDSAGAPRHHELGMFSEIRVTAGPALAIAAPIVDTITGMDYAYRAPATLAPGVHHLAFVNEGAQRHELTVTLLRAGVTVRQFMDAELADRDVDELIEADLGLLHSLGRTAPLGLLRVELLPGREYLLECAFADSDSAPPHFRLGMFGSITVGAVSVRGTKAGGGG